MYIYLVTYCLCTCAQGFHSSLCVSIFYFFQPICCIISTFLPFEKVLFGHISLVLKLDCLLLSNSSKQRTKLSEWFGSKEAKGMVFPTCSTMLCVSWGNDPSIKVSGIIHFNKKQRTNHQTPCCTAYLLQLPMAFVKRWYIVQHFNR